MPIFSSKQKPADKAQSFTSTKPSQRSSASREKTKTFIQPQSHLEAPGGFFAKDTEDPSTFRGGIFSHDFSKIPVYAKGSAKPQAKLMINALGDAYKHDTVDRDQDRHLHLVMQEGFAGDARPLPHFERIQSAFGPVHDLSNIRAHTDLAAEQATRRLSAFAFTLGSEIAFRGKPDVHLAAHEAAHVVQQRSGIQFLAGVESKGAWERHADAVADRVVQGRSAVDLLAPFTASTRPERVHVQFQKTPKADNQSSRPKDLDLDELAKWPDQALDAWSTLNDSERILVTLAISVRYGSEFAKLFQSEARLQQHKQSVNYYYGPGITWITPKKLSSGGFRLAQRDSVHEWWVHPKGDIVTRRWDQTVPTPDWKSSDSASPVQETKPTAPIPEVSPTPPDRNPPSDEACMEIQRLSDAICENANRICRIANELGDDEAAQASCQRAQRSCKDAQERAGTCSSPLTP